MTFTTHVQIHRKPKTPKTRHFLSCHEFSCTILFKLSFGYFSKLLLALFIAVNEVNSKYSQISRSVINFQGKILIFKEFQMPP